jgi:hypothetical protein
MQLIAPDILEEAQGLSTAVSGTALLVGFLLWLLGWRGHRFWIVLATTICAGIMGLYAGPAYGSHAVVAGVLLAVAAGALALALVRVVAFAGAGISAWLVVRSLVPAWDEPIVFILVGGLIGLLLFRLWTMALTSLGGTLLMMYSGLCLAKALGNVDVVDLATKQGILLSGTCGGIALLGLIVQFVLERQRARQGRKRSSRPQTYPASTYGGTPWWSWGSRSYRRAG